MPLVRLGLAQPDSINLLVTASTFSAYHATRNSDLGRNLSNLPNLPFLDLQQQLSAAWIFSETLLADAEEVKLPCTRYRPQIADLDFEVSAGNVISEPLVPGVRALTVWRLLVFKVPKLLKQHLQILHLRSRTLRILYSHPLVASCIARTLGRQLRPLALPPGLPLRVPLHVPLWALLMFTRTTPSLMVLLPVIRAWQTTKTDSSEARCAYIPQYVPLTPII